MKQPRLWLPKLEDNELLSQTQVLRYQQRLRLEKRRNRPRHPAYHPSLPLLSPQQECPIPSDEEGSSPDEDFAPDKGLSGHIIRTIGHAFGIPGVPP
jgi:hypothetical protein